MKKQLRNNVIMWDNHLRSLGTANLIYVAVLAFMAGLSLGLNLILNWGVMHALVAAVASNVFGS
jgi:hypothetical protein